MSALVEVRGLTVRFPGSRGAAVVALNGIDLEVHEGETLGVVGESGSGKTTLARALLGLQRRDAGSVSYRGEPVAGPEVRQPRLRRRAQIVFQDPEGSLNPRFTVEAALDEVLRFRGRTKEAAQKETARLLDRVGLSREVASALPHALSGGQRQRVGIARALAVEPEFLILDEPVSALDVSVQARILNLLLDLQEELGLTYLFISHDVAVVRRMSDRIAVLDGGRVVEVGTAAEIVAAPAHPYTRALLVAAQLELLPGAGTRSGIRERGPGTGA